MTWTDRLAVLALAAGTIIPPLLLAVKVSSFRGDMHDKWRQRSGLCAAALEDRATRLIERLRDEAIKLVGEPGAPFQPNFALADPDRLTAYVSKFQDALSRRSKLNRWLNLMLKSAGVAPAALALYVVGGIDLTVYYANWWTWWPALPMGLSMVGLGVLLGTIVLVMHYYFDRRLSSAEIIANDENLE